jgi:hypothetical protein
VRNKWLFDALLPAAVVVAVCGVAIGGMAQFARWPFPLENWEGGCVIAAKTWAAGADLYVDGLAGHVPLTNYPPLYLALLRVFAVSGSPFLAGRLIGVASVLGLAALAFAFVRQTGAGRFAAGAAAAAVLLTRENLLLAPMVRCDALAAALSLAGVVVAYRWASSRAGLAAAAAICVAAWFTKQTAVVAPVAVFAWRLASERRAAARFAAYYAVLLGGAIGLAELAFHGLFLRNIIGFSRSAYSLADLAHHLVRYVRPAMWPWRAVPLAGAAFGLVAAGRAGWRQSPWPAYFALCALSLAALGKEGATLLYFYEFHAACAVGFGLGVSRIALFDRAAGRIALAGAALCFAALTALLFRGMLADLRHAGDAEAVNMVRAAAGPVLLEDSGYGLLAGVQQMDLITPFIASRLAARGQFDFSPWIDNVRARRYALIQLESPADRPSLGTSLRFPASLLSEIARDYVPAAVAGHGYFYLPKAAQAAP